MTILNKFFTGCAAVCTLFAGIQKSNAQTYLDQSKPVAQRVENAMSLLTLEEKVALTHAQSKFSSKGVPRLGIPDLWMDDGPHGVRAETLWDAWGEAHFTNDSCTAFPALTCLAATWNPQCSYIFGKAIGEEARYRNKNVLLGPGVNIYRSPLNGRNFEYMGEDPYLSSQMVVPYITGVQENGVAACVKHFALNNQETRRGYINVQVSDRALNEIYLPAFKAAITKGNALTIMAAYNKIDGSWCAENEMLLKTILKKEWGFEGAVISDWGAVHSTLNTANNGLDIEMGTDNVKAYHDYFLADPYLKALRSGKASMQDLDDKVRRILTIIFKTAMNTNKPWGSFATDEHMATDRKIAEEGIVLLQNNGNLLPINPSVKSIAVIGENATRKMTVGGGSSALKTKIEISPLDGLKDKLGNTVKITYAEGYSHLKDHADLIKEAVEAAKNADEVIFFGGLSKDNNQDCEGSDRKSYDLPFGQDELINALLKVNKKVVVVLISGNAVAMPWASQVPSVVQAWYGGSQAGAAIANILTGAVNPSGKLPFTFPKKLADCPAFVIGDFPGDSVNVAYKDDIFVGYRYYDTYKVKPQFAFGHGLSYTTFKLDNLQINKDQGATTVTLTVKNTGTKAGAEVVQLYVNEDKPTVKRPEKELKSFKKVFLQPGEQQQVTFALADDAFMFYDPQKHWISNKGLFNILVGTASDDVKLSGKLSK
jgi:beta-glucosidase